MSIRITVSPGGVLRAAGDARSNRRSPPAAAPGAGAAEGGAPPDAEPPVHFFPVGSGREFAARLCRVPESDPETMFRSARPDAELLAAELFDRPSMTGGEYLTLDLLTRLHEELEAAMRAEIARSGLNVPDYLRTLSPAWSSVGKLSFHLAENKKNEDGRHPFAFLATFIHRLSENDQPRHLPLAAALKTFSGRPRRPSGAAAADPRGCGEERLRRPAARRRFDLPALRLDA